MTSTNITLLELSNDLKEVKTSIDDIFILINGIIVSLLQAGFACLEAGSVRTKNSINIMMKNLLDLFICALAYCLVGYGLAYGSGSKYLGLTYMAAQDLSSKDYPHWFFQFVFAATATTILSGAVAERCNFAAYLIYSPIISGVTYPIASHWAWAEGGWLNEMNYKDFAGCGPVHAFAGVCSFIAAAILGPRRGRFDDDDGKPLPMPGHSLPLVGLGALLIISGFLSFNGGTLSHAAHPGDGAVIARSMINTVLAGSGGSIVSLILGRMGAAGDAPWPFSFVLNGTLAGMVAVCAGADLYEFWAAICLGAISGFIYYLFHNLALFMKVDDPLDTMAVHFGAGFWGAIAMPIFAPYGILYTWSSESFKQLGYNLAGVMIISTWAGLTSLILFGVLRLLGIFRVSAEEEFRGLDETKHGESAYPVEAWDWECLKLIPEKKPKNKFTRHMFENEGFEMEKK